jgi:hypothetical protein
MEPTKNNNWLPWAAVAVLAFLLLRGDGTAPDPKPDDPTPKPAATAADLAGRVLEDTGKGYAAAFRNAADEIDAGRINTDRELVDNLAPATLAARQSAKVDFDAAFEREMPDGAFGDRSGEVAALLREIAKGFE